MPEIILARDGNVTEAACELLDLAGPSGRVEVRTGRSGPSFEVDDATYDAWERRHKGEASDEQLAANGHPDGRDGTEVVSDDQVPEAAINADPGDVDLGGDIAGDELPAAAVNATPPQNGAASDDADGDDDQAEPQPRKAAARKATSRATRSRSGSGE